jgi:PAS domain S-box-containing protein
MAIGPRTPVEYRSETPVDHERQEFLYGSDRTRVYRAPLLDGTGSVVCKELLGAGAAKRLRHERTILERLAGVEGTSQLAGVRPDDNVLVLRDSGGTALADLGLKLDVTALLTFACDLAAIVSAVHRRGVIHRDVNPANIVVAGEGNTPVLIDFEHATTFAQERLGFTHQDDVVGTLAYLAPEQTGRTGRPVDQRADLYALGATLYALAVGRPPFADDGDALRLIHDHLARVPTPPVEFDVGIPAGLSDIILKLLEKEPDRRYQSAEGLARDLARLRDLRSTGADTSFALGERDFPMRLSPPSRLIGRDGDIAALVGAFAGAAEGRARGVLISGAPSVGKTALVDELRPIVTAAGGWFVVGRFDRYRRDTETDGVRLAVHALGRLMLAEPEESLAALRTGILDTLGANAGLLGAIQPEIGRMLGITPMVLTPNLVNVKGRLIQIGIDLMRVVASPARPVVMVLEDLQWATDTPLGFLDATLTDGTPDGLLLVGTYRDTDVEPASPLSALLPRWERLEPAPLSLRPGNLPPAELAALLAEMLRLPSGRAGQLADIVSARTGGNPGDTVELVNELRRDGALLLDDEGWGWDEATIRRFVGRGHVADRLPARIAALAPPTRALLEVMACLGGEVNLDLLQAAGAWSATAVEEHLAPVLEDGLVEQAGQDAVRFRNDRVQEAAQSGQDAGARRDLQLTVARRLAARPEHHGVAAEQYLAAVDAVTDPDERRGVAVLFRDAATSARLTNTALAERFLVAAAGLLAEFGGDADALLLAALQDERHAVLYGLGRLEEADALYHAIERRCAGPLDLAGPACVQVASLTNRAMLAEAIALGADLLRRLGTAVPEPADVDDDIERCLDRVYRWVAEDAQADDLGRPEPTDRRALAVADLVRALVPALYVVNPVMMSWLLLETQRLWAEYGPCAALVANITGLQNVFVSRRQDYRTGYAVVRRALAVGDARGYEPETSEARAWFAAQCVFWHESLEESGRHARMARDGLLRAGQLQIIAVTYMTTSDVIFECAPDLDAAGAELDAALAYCSRTNNEGVAWTMVGDRQLIRMLRGGTDAPNAVAEAPFDEAAFLVTFAHSPLIPAFYFLAHALGAAIFGDVPELQRCVVQAAPVLPYLEGSYPTVPGRLLQAMAAAERVRAAAPAERTDLLAELDACRDWLALRAADAPGNVLHLLRLVEAERAWAMDDFPGAARAFDAALREVHGRPRPWHRALITERAAMFHLGQGLEHTGRSLLAEARRCYQTWGATEKVRQLDRRYPFVRPTEGSQRQGRASFHTTTASSEAIDLLGVLKASQTLSSETNLDRLRVRVVDVLSAMTGATTVQVLLWNPEVQGWFMLGESSAASLSAEQAGARGLIPLSAFRYADRTREPLLVDDTSGDGRFAHDPYLAGLGQCSLLVIPILTQGAPRAMLLLENRLSRGAFTADRLDAVMLIAGQLAVCFDNALAERFRSLVQRSSDLTLVCDRDGVLTYVSAASAELLGIDDAALTGQAVAELVRPDDRAVLAERIRQAQRPGAEPMKCQALHAGGSQRGVEITFTDLCNDPAVRGVMLHLRDVTESQRLEVELHHAQKLESVGRLAAGIAHEINTPIQFISDNVRFLRGAFVDLMRLREAEAAVSGADDETAQHQARAHARTVAADIDVDFLVAEIPDAFDQTLEGTSRVATIVRAMKAFGYTGNDEKSPADLNEAIANTLVVATSELKFVADVRTAYAELPPVWCHVGDINQVVLNLVINAAHAIGSADRGRGVVTVATRLAGDQILIEITDTGTGIPADVAEKIFEPFFTTKEVGAGTGQGLALSRSLIVDRHGGSITFATEPGAGTTFTVRLPWRVEPPAR